MDNDPVTEVSKNIIRDAKLRTNGGQENVDDDTVTKVINNGDIDVKKINEGKEKLKHSEIIDETESSQQTMEDKILFHEDDNRRGDDLSSAKTENEKITRSALDLNVQSGVGQVGPEVDISQGSLDNTESESVDNLYDDTKPKRLKHSKIAMHDVSDTSTERLMQGIGVLISPDEQPHRSPTRRKGVSGASFVPYDEALCMPDRAVPKECINNESSKVSIGHSKTDVKSLSDDETDNDSSANVSYEDGVLHVSDSGVKDGFKNNCSSTTNIPGSIYLQESTLSIPEKNGNTCSLAAHAGEKGQETNTDLVRPKQRSTKKHSYEDKQPYPQEDTTHGTRRGSSTDILIHAREKCRLSSRKTSADANLEKQYSTEQEFGDIQPQRRRRVSFGMVAYVKKNNSNQHEISPLNDEIRLFGNAKERPVTNKAMGAVIDKGNDKDTEVSQRMPTIQITEDEESVANDETQFYLQNGNGSIPMSTQGCDNLSYVPDDGERVNYDSKNIDEKQHIAEHIDRKKHLGVNGMRKTISTQSLPVGVGLGDGRRLSWQSDESPVPKGILKNKTTSSESLASSTASPNEKRFKVRKDSIALFTDQHGQIGLVELRKQYSASWKHRLNLKRLWSKRTEILKNKRTHFFVFGIFSCILAFVIVGLHLHSIHKESLAIARKVFFDAKARVLYLYDREDDDQVSGTLGLNIPKWLLPSHCHEHYKTIHDRTCLIWKEFGTLEIQFMENAVKCYNISWSMEPGIKPKDCFDIGNNFWYGPSNSSDNSWPVSWNSFEFDTSSVRHFDRGTFEFVTEYYWLATNGGAIYVDSRFPLQVTWNKQNNRKLCLSLSNSGDFYAVDNSRSLSINYVVCNSNDMLKTHNYISEKFIPNLQEIPDTHLMKSPHWSTASHVKKDEMNESVIMELTENLRIHNFNCSTIELDGQWESKIGDFSFSKTNFPNMSRVLEAAANAGCEFSLYLFPYFDISSRNFPEGLSRELFIKSIGEQVPALVKWQYGVAAMLDVSNSSARDWFTNKIRQLESSYGIDTFRFAYGDLFWLPHKPVFSQEKLSPNKVKNLFSNLFSSFGDIVIESTSRSQHISGFIGISSSIVINGQSKCLKNIIANVLNLGHLGYPLVMSDGFETESSSNEVDLERPSRDLFIRWMQLSVFFPSMRYTVKPWEYDKEVANIAKNLSHFHREVVLPVIKKSEPDILQGKPIMRPLWWRNPNDKNTFQINDQFLLGDKYLVAPVLCEGNDGIAERDIYVPKGIWRDIISNTIIPGPKWIYGYQVNQNEIPYFKQEELHFSVQ